MNSFPCWNRPVFIFSNFAFSLLARGSERTPRSAPHVWHAWQTLSHLVLSACVLLPAHCCPKDSKRWLCTNPCLPGVNSDYLHFSPVTLQRAACWVPQKECWSKHVSIYALLKRRAEKAIGYCAGAKGRDFCPGLNPTLDKSPLFLLRSNNRWCSRPAALVLHRR